MPGFNGSGPDGSGPLTGKGMGGCGSKGTGAGRGCGRGAGAGRGQGGGQGGGGIQQLNEVPAAPVAADNGAGADVLGAVMQRLDAMQADLNSVKKRLDAGGNAEGTEGDGI